MPKPALKTTTAPTAEAAKKTSSAATTDYLEIFGAREHNLKNIDLKLPRNQLVVITGISGSGKSSLAFDTIYAEGQRRYMESFSAYARSFLGNLERPEVDKITGLSPVIAIEQKTTSKNPRSTVGTVTEIYDFFRLLYARSADAYSYVTGKKMVRQTEEQIIELLLGQHTDQRAVLLAPLIRGRKGHYRELFKQLRKEGYTKVRVDGAVEEIEPKMQLDRYKTHDIELVIDRLVIREKDRQRLVQSVGTALKKGKGVLLTLLPDAPVKDRVSYFSLHLMDPESGIAYDEPAPNLFSFNSPYGACPNCNGLGEIQEITPETILPNDKLSISRGAIAPLGEYRDIWIFKKIEAILKKNKFSLSTPIHKLPKKLVDVILYGDEEPVKLKSTKYPGTTYQSDYPGIINFLKEQQEQGSEKTRQWVEDFTTISLCTECEGTRINQQARHFKIADHHIGQLALKDLNQLAEWLEGLEERLSERQKIIGKEVLKEIRKRLGFLLNVGLGYLTMNRPLRSLSGGEAQRIRLATQIGTQLTNVLYILDEPSIGLHQRDNAQLIEALKNLRNLGNSVIVVEHDRDMMLEADHLVDVGPGAGVHGGKIVAQGTPQQVLEAKTITANYLNKEVEIALPEERRKGSGEFLTLSGTTGHNLKNVTLKLPLGVLTCVTGVSGSGKSSLIHQTLVPILKTYFYKAHRDPLAYKKIEGIEHLDKIIEVDQSPIGRTPRSNPATYTGVFTEIRALFTHLPEAKIRGYKPGRFSFNVKGGRCEGCQGAGKKLVEMDFLPDVYVDCEMCRGKRYNRETLEIRWKGKSISDVLDMTVEQAVEFFENQPKILRKIATLQDVGLGYITLGQHATTLSGGEAQRVKLATELSKRDTGQTLYILDEPSTGLHFQDIQHLLTIVQRLVDRKNTVLIIEHNMDIIKVADHIIDLGPEGGAAGGQIIAEGTPEKVAKSKKSHTATYLKEELN